MRVAEPAGRRAETTGPPQPSVTLDGTALPPAALGVERLVDPGPHLVHVTAQGWKDRDERVAIADGGQANVTVALEPAAASAPTAAVPTPGPSGAAGPPSAPATSARATAALSPASDAPSMPSPTGGARRMLGWAGIATGGAGIVAGLVTGALATSDRSSAAGSPCASAPCDASNLASYRSDRSSFYGLGTASTVAFAAGGILAAAGVVLLVTAPRAEHPATAWVGPFIGAGAAGVTGGF